MRTKARYEFKYLIRPDQQDDIRRIAELYCTPDDHGVGGCYPVHSLYLDTRDWMTARQTHEGLHNRFELRLRTYGLSNEAPIFVEDKRRVGSSILKTRTVVDAVQARAVIRGDDTGLPSYVAGSLARIVALDLSPRLWVRYDREAYGSRFGDRARLTFDRALAVQVPDPDDPLSVDPEGFSILSAPTILELKFSMGFPSWMAKLVHGLGLERVRFGKYAEGAARSMGMSRGGPAWMN